MINLTARGTRLTVGGKDFSKALVAGSVSDALIDRSGVVLRSGSIELARVADLDESLDPRLNLIRWARGVEVSIELKTEAGAWAKLPCQELYILNAQPEDSQGARLTLELGCWLSLNEWQTSTDPEEERQPTEAESKPQVYQRQTLLAEFLGKLNVTGVSGVTLTGQWIGSVATDLQGGYLEKAGQLAYSSEQPCYLVAEGKAVRLVPIDLAPAPFHQVAIGVGEKTYAPQTAEPPVERYVCTASPLVQKPETEWERSGACVSRRYSDSGGSELWEFCTGDPDQETYRLQEPETVLDPDSSSTGLRTSQRRIKQQFWAADDGRLLTELEVMYRPRIAVLAGAYGELDEDVPDPWGEVMAERTTVTYAYDPATKVLAQRKAVTQKTIAEIAPRIVANYSLPANFTSLRDAEMHIQSWFRDTKGRWVATERKLRARNLAQSQVVDALEGRGTYDMVNVACNLVRVPIGEGGAQAADSGASQPPATQYRSKQDEADKFENKDLKGVATFEPIGGSKYRPQKVVEDVPLAQTETALAACARVGGSLLLGRHQGATLEIPVADKFLGPGYLPLKRIDVIDRQSVKSFLADGATWAFSQTEALLGFAHLCWLGTAPYVAPTGVSGATIQISTAGTGLVVGSELRFAAVPGGGLPPGLGDRPYYVVAVSPTGIQVAETPGGVPVLPGAPPPAPALPPADGLPLPGGGAIDPAPAFGGAAFVVVPSTTITVPYSAFESVLNPSIPHLAGLRLGASHGVGRSADHLVGLGLGVSHSVWPRVDHLVGLRLGVAHGAEGGKVAPHQVGLGLGAVHGAEQGKVAAHLVGLGLGTVHGVEGGKVAAHLVGLRLGAAHGVERSAVHLVGLRLGAAHGVERLVAHQVGLGLGAAHGAEGGKVAPRLVGLGLGAAHGAEGGKVAAHLVGLRLGATHLVQNGDVGALYAIARAKGSLLSPKDAAVVLSRAGGSVEAGLAIVPDL